MSTSPYAEPDDPVSFNTPDRETLNAADMEGLGKALLSLSKEVWLMKDRMMVLEAVLEKNGINAAEEIDRYQPDADMQKRLNEEGKAFVSEILNSLNSG